MRAMIGLLVTASLLIVVCISVLVYYLMLPHQVDNMDIIRISFSALSLDQQNKQTSNHSDTSWFSELNKLNLLYVNSSLPVTMDTTRKQIISPPRLRINGTQSNQWNDKITENNHCFINHKQYCIIITTLSCLLSVSVTFNVVLIYWTHKVASI